VAFRVGSDGVNVAASTSFALAATVDVNLGTSRQSLGSVSAADLVQITPIVVAGGEVQDGAVTVSVGVGWVPKFEKVLPALSKTGLKVAETVSKFSVNLTTPPPEP
jgi:hypothetical protein